jgi:hypothetical protein
VCLPSAKLAIVHRRRGAIKFYTMAKETMALVSRWRLPFLNWRRRIHRGARANLAKWVGGL